MQEGIVKYRCEWIKEQLNHLSDEELANLNHWRTQLIDKGLIGVLPDKIGYGNISVRHGDSDQFIITGSQTGHLQTLNNDNLALITGYSIAENYVKCSGMTKASSESLSHAAFYEYSKSYNAVIHIHSLDLWNKYLHKLPTTDVAAQYGTPELANSLLALLKGGKMTESSIIVMGGHKEGIIVGGFSLDVAANNLLRLCSS